MTEPTSASLSRLANAFENLERRAEEDRKQAAHDREIAEKERHAAAVQRAEMLAEIKGLKESMAETELKVIEHAKVTDMFLTYRTLFIGGTAVFSILITMGTATIAVLQFLGLKGFVP